MYSIIMPIYNCARFIENSVRSVLNQTYEEFELILIDDDSSDNTLEIAKNLSLKDKRVRLFKQSHKGVSAARNLGIEKSCGEEILFIDGDDSWDENLLLSCEKLKDYHLVVFGIQSDFYNNDDVLLRSEKSMSLMAQPQKVIIDKRFDSILSTYNMASPCNKVYKKKF